jgi:hypothetical protein
LAVLYALGVKLVRRRGDLPDFIEAEKAADDGVSLAPIMLEIGLMCRRHFASKRLRRTHNVSPPPRGKIQQLVDKSMNFRAR